MGTRIEIRPVDWGQVIGHVAAGDGKGALRVMDRIEAESRGVFIAAVRRKRGEIGHDHWCPDHHDEFCPPSLRDRLARLAARLRATTEPTP